MIIKTKRPASIFIVDSAITAVAWFAFLYQFTKGLVFVLSEAPGAPFPSILGFVVNPTMATLITCFVVCLFNAALVYLWARWQNARRHDMPRTSGPLELPSDTLASHFSLSLQQLDNVRDSRVTVVYHSPAGGITHLETSDLQLQQVTPSPHDSELRVA